MTTGGVGAIGWMVVGWANSRLGVGDWMAVGSPCGEARLQLARILARRIVMSVIRVRINSSDEQKRNRYSYDIFITCL